MIDPVHLLPEEIVLLRQHFRKAQKSLIRERAQTILSAHHGFSPYQISQVLLRTEKTVREWTKQYQKTGLSSIFPRYKGDNAAKLTLGQKQQLASVLSQKPSDYGIPAAFWDISSLASYIKAEFGVTYASDESYRLIFLLHHFSFHLPDTFDRKRNEGKIEERMKEIRTEIAPFLMEDTWIVLASDECRIVWETLIRRLWLPKGKRSVINVERKRKAQSFIGFLDVKTGEESLSKLSWQKQDEIIPVLEALVRKHRKKRICIIWDNARFHHGKKIKARLSTTLKNIHLINLPAYAPDYNPQEHVWKYGKDRLANNQRDLLEETTATFISIITGRKYHYHI